jgi:hypothetical protein
MGGSARALLESGADPTISNNEGTTPMAVAKLKSPILSYVSRKITASVGLHSGAEGEICIFLSPLQTTSFDQLAETRGMLSSDLLAGGGAGLPPLEGPAGGRCGCELRGRRRRNRGREARPSVGAWRQCRRS